MADRKQFHADALSDFTSQLAGSAGFGGGYIDSPYGSVAKDANGWLNNLYDTNWLVRAAVNLIPDDCFKKGYTWVAESGQISKLEKEEARLGVRAKKKLALQLSRKDGEAYIYLDAVGTHSSELNVDRVGLGGLRFINVLRKADVKKGEAIKDPLSPHYMQPSYYEIGNGVSTVRIHPSRMIRFVNAPDPISGNGISVLSYMMQAILSSDTVRDNVVALSTEANIDIISVCDLMDRVADPVDAAKVAERYRQLRLGKATNKIAVLDKDGEEWTQRQVSFATLPDVIRAMRIEAASAIGVPYAILFDRESGLGTNGTTDLKNYYDSIKTMQVNDIEPACAALDEAVIRSALGSRPEEIYLEWHPLYELSESERATIAKTLVDAAGVAVDKGLIPAEVLSKGLVNDFAELGVFSGIEQDYADFLAGGGLIEEPDDEGDVVRSESGNSSENDEGDRITA